MSCSDLILVLLTHWHCEKHAAYKIKGVVSILKQIQKVRTILIDRHLLFINYCIFLLQARIFETLSMRYIYAAIFSHLREIICYFY